MNSRQRFLNAMRFESVDRAPLAEWGYWPETIERWTKEGLPKDKNAIETFGLDNWWGAGSNRELMIDFGPVPKFGPLILEKTSEYEVWVDGWGVTVKNNKRQGGATTQFLDFPIKDRPTWERYKERLIPGDPRRYPAEMFDETFLNSLKEREHPLILSSCASCFGWLRNMIGLENFLVMFYDDPGLVHEMVDYMETFIITTWGKVIDRLHADCANFWEDMAYKTGPFVSPKIFREFLLPSYRRTCEFFKQHGINIIAVDSDGNIEDLIPLFLEAGVNVIHPMEVAAGMDAVKLRKKYGNNLAFWGNIDKRVLTKGKSEIKAEVFLKVPPLIKNGGYVPFVDHHVPPDISLQNYVYYQNCLREIYGMEKLPLVSE